MLLYKIEVFIVYSILISLLFDKYTTRDCGNKSLIVYSTMSVTRRALLSLALDSNTGAQTPSLYSLAENRFLQSIKPSHHCEKLSAWIVYFPS